MLDAAALATLTAIKGNIARDRDALSAFVNLLPPPASPSEPPLSAMEIAAGLTRTVFFDGFDDPSTIDWKSTAVGWVSPATMAPPVKWASPRGGTDGYTMQNSILRIANDPGNGGGECLSTMVYPSGANRPGDPAHGFAFKGSAAISCAMACDPSKAVPGSRTWPAFWSLAQEQLQIAWESNTGQTCQRADGTSPHHMEFDFVELGFPFPLYGSGQSILCALNYWECNKTLTRPYPTCDWNGVVMANNNAISRPAGFDYRDMNVYTTVYLHPNDNNGRGLIQRFITRPGGAPFHISECDDSWAPGDALWSLIDAQSCYLILGAGAEFPVDIDYVCVRQR